MCKSLSGGGRRDSVRSASDAPSLHVRLQLGADALPLLVGLFSLYAKSIERWHARDTGSRDTTWSDRTSGPRIRELPCFGKRVILPFALRELVRTTGICPGYYLHRYPFNPASNPKFPAPSRSIADSKSAMDLGGFVMENHLQVSAFHSIDALKCPVCHLNQFNRGGRCGRCHSSLRVGYIELFLPSPTACRDSQGLLTISEELGRFIRRMRLRRGMTQTALAAATAIGISRTYLSRVENGRILPSVIAMIGIARAVGIDKITLRVSSSKTKTPYSSERS